MRRSTATAPLAAAVLAATGVLSFASAWQALDPTATLALPLGTLVFLCVIGAASLGIPRRLAALRPGPLLGAAALVLWSPVVLVIAAAAAGTLAVPAPLLVGGVAAAVAAVLLARADEGDGRRASLGAAAVAVLAAAALRHIVVGSRGLAPDDVAAPLAAILLVALALGRPTRLGSAFALGVVLAAYALVSIALVLGKPYHTDAVAVVHRAAEHLAAGADPYRALDTLDALDRFGLSHELATQLEDGAPLRSLNYPALAFLVPAPLVALGLGDIRVLYLAEVLVLAALLAAGLPPALRPLAPAALAANDVATRQHVLAGVDPAWAVLAAIALVLVARRWPSALALGLAAAARQQAWLLAPFYLLAVGARFGRAEAAKRAGIAALAFAAPNAPFLVSDADAWLAGVTAPLLGPLEPHGAGLVRLGMDGVLPLLPRGAYAALALVALLLVALALRRRPPSAPTFVLPLAALWLAWRSLVSYFALGGALALAGEPARAKDLVLAPAEEVPHAGRQGAARDPGVPGRPRDGP